MWPGLKCVCLLPLHQAVPPHPSPSLVFAACQQKVLDYETQEPNLQTSHNISYLSNCVVHNRALCVRSDTNSSGSDMHFWVDFSTELCVNKQHRKRVFHHRGTMQCHARLAEQKTPPLFQMVNRALLENNAKWLFWSRTNALHASLEMKRLLMLHFRFLRPVLWCQVWLVENKKFFVKLLNSLLWRFRVFIPHLALLVLGYEVAVEVLQSDLGHGHSLLRVVAH